MITTAQRHMQRQLARKRVAERGAIRVASRVAGESFHDRPGQKVRVQEPMRRNHGPLTSLLRSLAGRN